MITKGHNHISRKLSFYLMAGTIISLSGMTSPAQAGFNWTPPPPPPKASPAPDAVTAPLAPVESEAAPAAAPAPVAAAPAPAPAAPEKTSWAPQNPPAAEPATQTAAAVPPPAAIPAPVSAPAYKEIRGFGKDIPLAMAINQIVPADFTYSFAADVNSATAISWKGDRPWNVVLKESLEPAGLVAVIDNSTVKIEKWTDGSAGSWSAPAQTSMPAPQHYTDEQLAAIGSADNGNYQPKYPRHKPQKMSAQSGAAEEQKQSSSGMSWQPSSGDVAAAKDSSPASAGGQPTQLADKMQHQPAESAPASSSGMKWQPTSAPPPPAEEKTASAPVVAAAAPASAPSLVPSEAKTAGGAPAKAASMGTVSSWQAAKGESLHDTLSAWCGQSGVNLIWESKKDYKLTKTIDTKGTFTDAVMKLLTQYNTAKPRPVGQLHPNLPDGPPVLVIANEAGA